MSSAQQLVQLPQCTLSASEVAISHLISWQKLGRYLTSLSILGKSASRKSQYTSNREGIFL